MGKFRCAERIHHKTHKKHKGFCARGQVWKYQSGSEPAAIAIAGTTPRGVLPVGPWHPSRQGRWVVVPRRGAEDVDGDFGDTGRLGMGGEKRFASWWPPRTSPRHIGGRQGRAPLR